MWRSTSLFFNWYVDSFCSRKEDHNVYGVGYNSEGQLGVGAIGNVTSPMLLERLKSKVKKVIAGRTHAFFVTIDEQVHGTGYNQCYQLGLGTTKNRYHPKLNTHLSNKDFVEFALSDNFNLAVTEGKLVIVLINRWYSFWMGRISTFVSVRKCHILCARVKIPTIVKGLPTNVQRVCCNYLSCAAITRDGILYIWTNNQQPTKLNFSDPIRQVAIAYNNNTFYFISGTSIYILRADYHRVYLAGAENEDIEHWPVWDGKVVTHLHCLEKGFYGVSSKWEVVAQKWYRKYSQRSDYSIFTDVLFLFIK